jgi:translocation and assembly module TamB
MVAARSRRLRILAVTTVVLALLGLALWQLHDRLLARLIAQAVEASGGRLTVDAIQGSLTDGLRVGRLSWRDPAGLQLDLEAARLRLRWPELLRGRVSISSLAAERLVLGLPAGDGPPALPATIALPMPFELRAARLERLRIEVAGGPPVELSALELRADYEPARASWRVHRLALRSPWGDAYLSGTVDDAPPYRVRASAAATAAWRGLRLAATASGPLAELSVKIDARPAGPASPDAVLKASGTVLPLGPRLFGPVVLQARALTAADLGLAGPRAGLFDGEGELDWRSDAPGDGMRLSFDVRNRAPAPLDLGGLPLASASGRLLWRDRVWRVDELRARTGGAGAREGTIAGWFAIDPAQSIATPWASLPGVRAALEIAGLSAPAIDSRLPPAHLSGRVAIAERHIEIDLGDADRGAAALRAAARLEGERLTIERARLGGVPGLGGAVIQASGSVQAVAPWTLALEGSAEQLDLALLHDRLAGWPGGPPRGRVDLRWAIAGVPGDAAHPRALALRLAIERGSLQDAPLRGRASANLASDRLAEIDATIEHGPNRLQLSGALGRSGDRLDWQLQAAQAGLLGRLAGRDDVEGALQARGSWRGSADDPDLEVEANGSRLRVAGVSAARGTLALRLARDRLTVRAQAQTLQSGDRRIEQIGLEGEGSMGAHEGRLVLRQGPHEASLTLRGGLSDARWQGRVMAFALRGPLPARLREPVDLAISAQALRLGACTLEGDAGTVRLESLALEAGRWRIAGSASLRQLARAAEALGFERPVPAAEFDLDALTVDVSARLQGTGPADLDGSVAINARPPPGVPGAIEASLTLRAGELAGSLAMTLPTLAVVNRWIGPEWSLDGRLTLAARVSGTLAAPRLLGDVRGEALRLEQRSLGWRLGAGTLAARFDGDTLQLDSLRLHAGPAAIAAAARADPSAATDLPAGALQLTGTLRGADRSGRFSLRARSVSVPFGPGQRLVVSGEADVASLAGRFDLKGRVRADEGLIELRGGDAPSLPDDIEIATARPPAAGAGAALAARPARPVGDSSLRLVADLAVDLGDRLRVRGSGVDARLGGSLVLRGTLPDAPRAFGTVTVRDGSYTAYGQKLVIERGRAVFNGPIDNPALDIVALRPNLPVQAGVAVTGTVLSPRVRLTSRPDMSDAERLSWLVLGVAPEGAQTGAQTAALQAAAATLFGSNDGGLAAALGLDVLTVRAAGVIDPFAPSAVLGGFGAGGAAPGQVGANPTVTPSLASQNVVAIGKRLSSKVVVTYEQGLRGIWNLLRIQYELTDRLSVRAQTGSESAIDLLWRLSFD